MGYRTVTYSVITIYYIIIVFYNCNCRTITVYLFLYYKDYNIILWKVKSEYVSCIIYFGHFGYYLLDMTLHLPLNLNRVDI